MADKVIVEMRKKNDSVDLATSKSNQSLDKAGKELAANEKKVASLSELTPGDHIVIAINEGKKYCHSILEKVNAEKRIVEIIYFDDSQTQCVIEQFQVGGGSGDTVCQINASESSVEFKKKAEDEGCAKSGIKQSTIEADLTKLEVYKIEYDAEKGECLSADETLKKARKYVGQSKYNVFVNNDEHFAIYCKTGKAAKLFILDPKEFNTKNILGKSLSSKIVSSLAQQTGQIVLVSTAKSIATRFPRAAISAALPVAAEAAGTFIGVGVEGATMGYDIYKKRKENKQGKLSDIKFKKYIAKRVTRGTMSVAGGVAGGILGQIIIPVPVLGAVVGSLVGGIVGAGVGYGEGILIGELVEVIDNKIKQKKSEEEALAAEAARLEGSVAKLALAEPEKAAVPALPTSQSSYEVLHHLVFKYDKNLLKDNRFDYLKAYSENNKLYSKTIITNASEEINEEDYEIYVLKETDEVVTQLNIEGLFDSNGMIDKRKSLEAFSANSLPADLNVFFVENEEPQDNKTN